MLQSCISSPNSSWLLKRTSFFDTLAASFALSTSMYAAYTMPYGEEPIVLLVLDSKDEAPVIGVTFWSKKAAISEVSNAKGRVRIDRFRGQVQIEIQALGYRKIVLSYQELRALNDTLYLESEIFQLENVVVSATRWKQNYTSVSQAIPNHRARGY